MTQLTASIDHPTPATGNSRTFLRRALVADAAASGATGVLLLLGSTFLDALLGLPEELMQVAGLSLLPFAALVAYLATRARVPRGAARAVIAINAAWTAGSVLLLLSGWIAPTGLGVAFVVAQAAVVAGFAAMQARFLRGLETA